MSHYTKKYLTTKDFLVSGEVFDLIYDQELEMLRTEPQPSIDKLALYYESKEYLSHTDEARGLFASLYQVIKIWSIRKKLGLILKQNQGKGSLLDIGAGTGEFLKAAKEKGWLVEGVEPNAKAVKIAAEKGLSLESSLEPLKNRTFDVVTLWHVLEHMHNLDQTILDLERLVNPNGTLIIAVPNFKSFDAKHYGKFWAAYDTPRHLWHFSQKSLRLLFNNQFELKETLPMMFDSYYVSLLSEKYRTGSSFSFKGIWIGFVSNIKGRHSKEYSSHIYCFKKGKGIE